MPATAASGEDGSPGDKGEIPLVCDASLSDDVADPDLVVDVLDAEMEAGGRGWKAELLVAFPLLGSVNRSDLVEVVVVVVDSYQAHKQK